MTWHIFLNVMALFAYTLNGIVGKKTKLKTPCLYLYLVNRETVYLKNMIIVLTCNQYL